MTNEPNKPKIEIPETFMGVPIKGAMERVLSRSRNQPQTPVQSPSTAPNKQGMIYIPTAGIYFAKEKTHLNKNWYEVHELLAQKNLRMPTIEEFRRTLKYLRDSQEREYQELYNEITEVRNPWRANWLDADFKVDEKLYINYNHFLNSDGKLIPRNSEILEENTLMKDKIPGISLDDWLEGKNITNQGLPSTKISNGDLYYWFPRSDNNSVARFNAGSVRAGLLCNRDPSGRDSILGVFGVADAGQNAR